MIAEETEQIQGVTCMRGNGINQEQFEKNLKKICARDTAYGAKSWTIENYLWGHCTVVALLAQDFFHGEILRVSLKGTELAKSRFHFWNRFPDGTEADFTRPQFRSKFPKGLKPEVRNRKQLLRSPEVSRRYELLAKRFHEQMPK